MKRKKSNCKQCKDKKIIESNGYRVKCPFCKNK